MKTDVSPTQRVLAGLLLVWVLVTTTQVAATSPPHWASGLLYMVWFVCVWIAIVAAHIIPTILTLVGNRMFGKLGMLVFGFLTLWLFDTVLRWRYPELPLTPGLALLQWYAFLSMYDKDR